MKDNVSIRITFSEAGELSAKEIIEFMLNMSTEDE